MFIQKKISKRLRPFYTESPAKIPAIIVFVLKRPLLCCFLLLLGLNAGVAQDQALKLEGYVFSAENRAVLESVNIAIEGDLSKGGVTDENGYFSIKIDSLPQTLVFSSIGFETQKLIIRNPEELLITLFPISTDLPEIVVRSARKVDTVYHEPYNVVDYAFQEELLILLVYRNFKKKYELVLLDESETFIADFSLTEYIPTSLFKSCLGPVYLNTSNGAYLIKADEQSIRLGPWVEQKKYDRIIRPCILSMDSLLFYQRHLYQGQALSYYAFKNVPGASDSLTFLPLLEYGDNIVRLLEHLGVRLPWSGDFWDKRISGRLLAIREEPYFLKGLITMYYPKLYAPIIKKDSFICLFNHLESTLQYFDVQGNQTKAIPINYHKVKRWKKYVLYDEFTQKAYTAFHTRWGEYICEINLEDGSLSEAIPLDLDFIEKVSIRNGVLYFLHRNDYQGARNKTIQKVRVN